MTVKGQGAGIATSGVGIEKVVVTGSELGMMFRMAGRKRRARMETHWHGMGAWRRIWQGNNGVRRRRWVPRVVSVFFSAVKGGEMKSPQFTSRRNCNR